MDQRVTDALTEAAAAWVTLALQRLDERHLEAATACLEVDGAALASAPRVYFDVYRRAVESNRKRLSNRRWRWPR